VFRRIACVLALCVSSLPADEAVQPSLTIYNQNSLSFARNCRCP